MHTWVDFREAANVNDQAGEAIKKAYSLENTFLHILYSWERCVRPMCVPSTAQVNCVACGGVSGDPTTPRSRSIHIATACVVMLRVYSSCA